MLPDNLVSIDSISGDSFCVDDSDGVTWKWLQETSSADAAPDPCIVTMENNYARIFRDYTSGGSIRGCFFIGSSSFSGDFDLRVTFRFIDLASGANPRPQLCVWDTQVVYPNWGLNCDNANSFEGVWYQHVRTLGFLAYIHPSGGASISVGGATYVAGCESVGSSCWMRLTRVGNLYSWYYSVGGNGWILDETYTDSSFVNPLYGWFGTAVNTQLDSAEVWFDNYTVDSTINAGGFRLSGVWESNEFSTNNDTLSFVDFEQISAVGTGIERLDILVLGQIVESFTGFPVSPAILTTSVSGANVSLRFSFTGDGNGAATLGIVSAVMLATGGGILGFDIGSWLLYLILFCAGLILLAIGIFAEIGVLSVFGGLLFIGLGVLLIPLAPFIFLILLFGLGIVSMVVGVGVIIDE